MRVHRVRLRNYRGVVDSTVVFATGGVTVVEGDNEVGKTCIPEALDLILTALDSSRAKRVLDVRPVHRDEGPEVEVEIAAGVYAFVYSKRWHRLPRTTLAISSPRREQLTGREAHERVEQILAETLDADLWRALRVDQGMEVAMPPFDVPSLGRALDLAAGGELTGSHDDDLWDRVRAERDKYWTATGQVRGDRKSVERQVDEARDAVAALQGRLEGIARDAAEVDRRLADEARLLIARDRSEREERELQERWELLEQRRRDVESLAATHNAAEERRNRIAAEQERRGDLVQALTDRTDDLAALQREAGQAAPALAAVIAQGDQADAALSDALARLRVAEAAQRLANDDRDHHRQRIEVAQLTERHERVIAAQASLVASEALLDSARVDDDFVARIEQAHLAVVRAEAAAGSAAASLEMTALSSIAVQVDAEDVELDAGATSTHIVTGDLGVTVPDLLRFRVRAGSGSADRAAQLTRAREELQHLCQAGGVADLAEARRAAEDRHEAERSRATARKTIEQDLRDLTVDVLAGKIVGLSDRIESYAADRPGESPIPADFEQAKRIASEREREVAELEATHARCQAVAVDVAARRREAELEGANLSGRIGVARGAREHAADLLAGSRAERSDATLHGELAAAQQEVDEARRLREKAEAALVSADPDSLEVLLRNAADAVRRSVGERESNRERLQELRIGLQLQGEEGLDAGRIEAESRYHHLQRTHERTEARAQAAQLLHDTFARRRQMARRRYVAPFKERIEKFGRIVFGPTFEVELDDDLGVVRRTLDGITLDIDQLSIGAREQLGVLSRLACAAIVSPDGAGAPVIIDDALGWSDPSRLARMGAAIAAAGRECQVIVLTCTPGRYAHVGNAKVVTLPS